MQIKDKRYLRKILEEHHQKENSTSIKECPFDNCWHKKIFDELDLHSKRKKSARLKPKMSSSQLNKTGGNKQNKV